MLELKSIDQLAPVHHTQILNYMRLSQKKIGLSARAVGKESDPEDVRSYHETGSGMATLGDIANLLGSSSEKKSEGEEEE